jgi:hypothetical protein
MGILHHGVAMVIDTSEIGNYVILLITLTWAPCQHAFLCSPCDGGAVGTLGYCNGK